MDFLKASRASLGSSKSLVDLGGEGQAVLPFLSHLNQIGQTGATPRHAKGLSTCCHGEEPHTVGWRFISERRAINLDPNCGWARGKADVLYVADAFAVIAKVNELLAAAEQHDPVKAASLRLKYLLEVAGKPEELPFAAMHRAFDIVLGTAGLVVTIGLVGWLFFFMLKKSDEPAKLIFKWIFSALVGGYFFL